MALKIKILLLLLAVSIGSTGCNITRYVILHPIEKADIFVVKEGAKIYHLDGSETIVDRDGWFYSDKFTEEVMKTRIGK